MSESPSLGARAGSLLSRIYPRFDERVWQLRRRQHTARASRALRASAEALRGLPADRPKHVVVVAQNHPSAPNWRPGGGNLFFEVWQSAVELLGPDRVTLLGVAATEPEEQWHKRLLQTLVESGATHLVAQTETDPGHLYRWSWDVIGTVLADAWDGVWIGIMYDSAFPWLRLRARRLGTVFPRLLLCDLCEPIDGLVRPGQVEVGPMTMPLSYATLDAIDERVEGTSKIHQLTFIGALYDYRVELLNRIRDLGIDVAVNPHRPDPTTNFDESRMNQPTWLDYIAGLAQSELTINFSLASGGPHEQYKIRIQEAALVGCLTLTDDKNRTRLFFAPDQFAQFEDLADIGPLAAALLSDTDALRAAQRAARERARTLTRTDFWGRIDDGLRSRGLPEITGLTAPSPPGASA